MVRALAESETRFRAVQQTMPDGFVMYSAVRDEDGQIADFRCEFANPAAAAFAARSIGEMVGRNMTEIAPLTHTTGLFDVYCHVVETGATAQNEIEIPIEGGPCIWLRYSAVKLGDGIAISFADISKRKKSEAALRESEARFRAAQQTTPDGFMMFESVRDPNGMIIDFECVYGNPAGSEMTGREGRSLVGHRFWRDTLPQQRVGLYEIFKGVVETGETRQGEALLLVRPGGLWVRYSAVKVDDGFAVTFSDITARKEAELALRESEARFRAVQQTTPDGFMICRSVRSPEGRITDFLVEYINPAVERLSGASAPNMVGGHMSDVMPGNFVAGTIERYTEVVETGQVWQGEAIYPYRHSGERWHRVTAVRVGDGFAASFSDITEEKRAEALLKERDSRLRSILNNVVAFVGLLSTEGVLLEVNDPALISAGVERTDVLGKYFWDTYWWSHDADAREALKEGIARAAKGELVRYDVVIRTAGDNRTAIDFQLAPSFDEDGHVIEIIPSGVDISDRKRAEQHREMLVRELSHRVKNSLATVQTIASHTLREATDLDSFREAFVGRLMAISKCHDLLVDTTRRTADLSQLVRDQVLPYARAGASSQVRMSGPLIMLGAEASHTFGLVLHELATNAAKYGALSTEEGRLDISWKRGPDPTAAEAILEWRETGGPEVTPPTRRGFGSVLIEQSVAYSLGGKAEIEYRLEGLWARFRFPKKDRI
jgi:PAS domain S-box-containing protein